MHRRFGGAAVSLVLLLVVLPVASASAVPLAAQAPAPRPGHTMPAPRVKEPPPDRPGRPVERPERKDAHAAPAPRKDLNVTPEMKAAVDVLGSFDFPVRMDAARTIRRAPAAVAVPALIAAAEDHHRDWYVRFKSVVLLSGFEDPRTADTMRTLLDDELETLRGLAYSWFEHHPNAPVLPQLLAALDREESELVRPALTRALAARGGDPKVREALTTLVMSGQDLFRAAVIEALGEYKGAYALPRIMEVALLDGPLQDDAILAIGRIGDKKGLVTLADLQRTAPRQLQPFIAAAICLAGSNCASHEGFIVETLKFGIGTPGNQELVRSAAHGLAALAIAGSRTAAAALFELGAPTRDPERAAIALGIGNFALRNPSLLLEVVQGLNVDPAATLLQEAFDMLEEDFEEERFYVAVRRAYWAAPADSPARRIADTIIQKLEF